MSPEWLNRFRGLLSEVEQWSKDPNKKVSAIIINEENHVVLSFGYNGLPRGMNDNKEERLQRPLKYLYIEHAERNAIYNAARNGIKTEGMSLMLEWFPCADCARAIVQAGIKKLYCGKGDTKHPRWGESFYASLSILIESGVEISYLKEKDEK